MVIPEYVAYYNMRSRCLNPQNPKYKDYGARGIKICARWLGKEGFKNFLEDMGKKPLDTSIDRINNDGDYEPSNCRWADITTQARNRRSVLNTSGVIGVEKNRGRGRAWRAGITVYKKYIHLGYFDTLQEAITARKTAEVKYFKGA